MNHDDAVRLTAVEAYLLGELSPADRDEFEEHFFDCSDCANELRVTATFLEEAKAELANPVKPAAAAPTPSSAPERRPPFSGDLLCFHPRSRSRSSWSSIKMPSCSRVTPAKSRA